MNNKDFKYVYKYYRIRYNITSYGSFFTLDNRVCLFSETWNWPESSLATPYKFYRFKLGRC